MLVVQWEAWYAAIPRLQAEEQLQAYAVASTAHPAQDWQGVSQKQRVLDGWRQQMEGAAHRLTESVRRVSLPRLAQILGRVVESMDRHG